MSEVQKISRSEKQIMEIIWAAGRPVTATEIIAYLPADNAWKRKTVITFLGRLIDKGVLRATRISKAYHYEPCITEREYMLFEARLLIDDVFHGSAISLIRTLCDIGCLTTSYALV